ncbi:hypothetical protein METP2_00908 [Methanosarcinales archaeon]|nr:DUF262 domain-containing protein [Candidatus Methanoperedens sp.]CAG0962866.1 hypothetical protein METP2_00908 [Methanosarcinales archaeon]
MTRQIQASVSIKKISEIYQRIKGKTLVPQPEFQRKFVWNKAHKEKFIDTILNGYPFPEIYIAQKGIDLEKIENQEVVVDGQQRLSTIVQYIEEPEGSREFGKVVRKYQDLTEIEKREFLNYEVVFRALGDVEPETIIEIFKRINLTQYSLQQVEIENAVYDGEFITTAKEILGSIGLSDLPTFSDSEISRMADLYFILLLMSTIENEGYFNRDSEIETYIINFNDSYENSDIIKNKLISVFNLVKSLNLKPDTIWYRKSNLFTLLIELYKINGSLDLNQLKEKLVQFEDNIIVNKSADKSVNDFSKYYSYMYTGTNDRQARVVRSVLINKYVFQNN